MEKYIHLIAFVTVATYAAAVFAFTGLFFITPLPESGESHCRAVGAEVYKLNKDEIQSMMCVKKLETI